MWQTVKKYLSRLRYYDIFVIFAYVVSIPFDILLNIQSHDTLNNDDPIVNAPETIFNSVQDRPLAKEIFFNMGCSSALGSGMSYAGRGLDEVTGHEEKTIAKIGWQLPRHKFKYRNSGTLIGVSIGLTLGAIVTGLLVFFGGPAISIILTSILSTMALVGSCGGLGSRLGQVMDRAANDGKRTFRNYELAIIVSLPLAIIPLVFLGLSAGPALTPFSLLAFGCAGIVLLSNINSFAHYFGRALDLFTLDRTLLHPFLKMKEPSIKDRWEHCNNENLATFISGLVGLGIGITFCFLPMAIPGFILLLPALLKFPLIITAAMNMAMSVGSKLGRAVDHVGQEPTPGQDIQHLDETNYLLDDDNDIAIKQARTLLHIAFNKSAPVKWEKVAREISLQDRNSLGFFSQCKEPNTVHRIANFFFPCLGK